MNGDKTVGPLALQRIGEALRSLCRTPTRVPFRLYSLVAQLKRMTREGDYLHNAVETMRLAEHADSPTEKARLVMLADGLKEASKPGLLGRERLAAKLRGWVLCHPVSSPIARAAPAIWRR